MDELIRPETLSKLSDDARMAKAQEKIDRLKKQDKEKETLHAAFMEREIHEQVRERVNLAVRQAAEQGLTETEILTFPASYCNDGGRSIINKEPEWPDSLEGFAKRAHDYFKKDLEPLGYQSYAKIVDYVDGMPGNIKIYLKW